MKIKIRNLMGQKPFPFYSVCNNNNSSGFNFCSKLYSNTIENKITFECTS